MNREIKFRAWDSKRQRMMQPFLTFEKHPADGLVTETTNWHDENDMQEGWDTSNQVNELMQYTGLKDKNGKEIYEGDILTAYYVASSLGQYKNKVVFNQEEAAFSFANAPLWAWEDVEIIGNIYEHPELIKAA